ncbi:FxSxx-COOH system tetratricopeptide repeat protein [Micromonospora fluostatini]
MTAPGGDRPDAGAAETRVTGFVAAARSTGRTNVVSNLALLLARAGRRVLVVDAGRGAVRVHEHLRAFHAEDSAITDHLPTALTDLMFALPGFATGEPTLRRYAVPPGRLDVLWTPDPTVWPAVTEVGAGPDGALRIELRRQLRFTEYDDVLLEPADFAETVAAWLAVLCDAVVVCLPYHRPALADAAAVARQVQRAAPAGVRIVAATTGLTGDEEAAARYAEEVRSRFLGVLHEPAVPVDFAQVEIAGGPSGQPLAPLLEESRHRDGVLTAYGALLGLLTAGEVDRAAPEPDPVRDRYRYGVGRQPVTETGAVSLAYPEIQRPWADWLRDELTVLGLQVRRWGRGAPPVDGPVTVLAVAPDPPPPRATGAPVPPSVLDDGWLAPFVEQVHAHPGTELLVVRTTATPGLRPDPARVVDLAGCTEEAARRRLRGTLGLAAVTSQPGSRPWRVGFPGGRDRARPVSGLPPAPRRFVGRDRELAELRDHLLASRHGEPVTVRGPAAAGKTSLVRTYVDRFRADYGLVEWIPARSRHDVWRALAALADRLGVGPRGSVPELLRELGRWNEPWLLVYDGVADGVDLAGLLPTGPGHVVLTRPGTGPSTGGTEVTVAELTRADAVRLLTRQVTGLTAAPAAAVVDAVGALPLDLWLASGLLEQAGILLTTRETVTGSRAGDTAVPAFLEVVAPTGADPAGSPTRRIVEVALGLMGEELSGRVAVVLAQMFAFAAPDGLSLTLVQSRRMRTQVAAGLTGQDAALLNADGLEMDRALTVATRYRLFDVAWGDHGVVRMHPAVQAAVRACLTPPEEEARRGQFLLGLAGAAPRSTAAGSALRRELHQHLLAAGALEVDDPHDVRRFLVEQLEHLIARGEGESAEARRLWRPLLDRWLARHGWGDRLTLRLATRLADVTRMLGYGDEALELSRVVVEHGATLLGHDHPRVLVSRRGLAGDLRGVGRFRPALIEDQATWRGFRDQFGNSHPETLVAAYNLANSYHLAGWTDEAVRVARDTLHRRLRLFDENHPATLRLAGDLGRYLAELGGPADLAESYRLLQDVYQRRVAGHGEEDMLLLRTIRHQAVTERRRGYRDRAKDLNSRAYLALRRLLGEDSPATRSCRLSLAVDYHLAGESDKAVRLADDSLAGYERDLVAGHPFVHLSRSLRAVLRRGTDEADETVTEGGKAATGLVSALGESHPWALAGQVNQAGNLAAVGRVGAAEELLRGVLDEGRHLLGVDHPYLRAARRLLAVVLTDGEISGGRRPGSVALDFVDLEVPET